MKSQVGFGSTFTLLLPDMPRCEEDTAQPAAEAVMAETLHEAPTLLHTVALLDDDLLQLQLSEAMLKNVLDPMQTIYAFNDCLAGRRSPPRFAAHRHRNARTHRLRRIGARSPH